ncbi:hypothetical protein [Salegentibacter sediminis]|uniref:hypothetical protein n=1 Tax=Salegentibacter sediminis TaxID=1930251 RepID=UPI0009C02BAE|nr:hypothetical protein [Salegentibacter sediminis]
MTSIEKTLLAISTIDFPVHYEDSAQTIRDAKGMMICDIRGWSKIQFMTKAQERHDAIGNLICNLLNDYKDKQVTDFDEMMLGV